MYTHTNHVNLRLLLLPSKFKCSSSLTISGKFHTTSYFKETSQHIPCTARACRQVKLADSGVQSYGGLTTCTDYHLIPKRENVVDSVFIHDKHAGPGGGGDESAMVVFTEHRVWSLADEEDSE